MKSYKIWILFIFLSAVSFGAKPTNTNTNNAVSVWVESIGFDLSTNTLNITLKSRTGEKFEEIDKLKLDGLQIINGLNDVSYPDVSAERVSDVVENPKIVTKWYAEIELGFTLVNEPLSINGKVFIDGLVDGNQHAIDGKKLTFGPFTIAPNDKTELRIYEKLSADTDNWLNTSTGITGSEITVDGYIFTKGGPGSLEDDPGVYVLISTDGGAKIEKIKIKKNDDPEEILTVPYPDASEAVIIKIDGFESNKINTVAIIPISIYGVEGAEVTLDFLIDTKINTIYLGDGIIGELDSDRTIQIDLSKIKELSGIEEYSYIFTVGNQPESDNESNLNGESFTILTENSITSTPKWVDGKVGIPTSTFIGGSKATLLFTVYDKLGHEKVFEKTYFIPKQLDGITSKVSNESKQRESKIKIVTEGSSDKFGIDSSVDKSSESE